MNITVPEDEPVTLNCKASVTSSTSTTINRSKMYGSAAAAAGSNTNLLFSPGGHHPMQLPHLVIEWFKEGRLVPTTSSQGDPHAHR